MKALILNLVLSAAWATPALAQTQAPGDAPVCYTRQDLSARSNGFVTRVLVRDGQEVKKGDLIAELDNRALRAALKEAKAGVAGAKANVALAEDAHRRLKKLAASDTVAEQELFNAEIKAEQARAQFEAAQATLERVQVQLDDTRLKAEIDGRVSGLPQVKGLFVQAGHSLGRVEAASSSCAVSR